MKVIKKVSIQNLNFKYIQMAVISENRDFFDAKRYIFQAH